MLTTQERRAIVAEVSRLAFESTSVEALGAAVMPALARLVDASSSVFYRINEHGHLVPMAGTLIESGYRYSREYYEIDPMQFALRSDGSWVFKTERNPRAWREYLDGPVYNDLCRHYDIHRFLHLRLANGAHGARGTYGIMLAHGEHQPEFTEQDELELIEVLPALEAAVRRGARESDRQASSLALEAALESAHQPIVIFDARGGLVWSSKRASAHLGWNGRSKPVVPAPLLEAVLKMGALIAGERASAPPRTTVRLAVPAGELVVVELRIGRTDVGVPVIVAELQLRSQAAGPSLASRFGLTAAQGAVLASLAEGLSDRAIAERHEISLATVRSHLGQILAKLGVESRLQAALLAARDVASAHTTAEVDTRPRNAQR